MLHKKSFQPVCFVFLIVNHVMLFWRKKKHMMLGVLFLSKVILSMWIHYLCVHSIKHGSCRPGLLEKPATHRSLKTPWICRSSAWILLKCLECWRLQQDKFIMTSQDCIEKTAENHIWSLKCWKAFYIRTIQYFLIYALNGVCQVYLSAPL